MKEPRTAHTPPPPFDLRESPLDGTALIEAGAGTGKTFTITGIVLRLIIERGMPIGRILVVTFTEAATEELKGRIRSRLKEALGVLRKEIPGDKTLRQLAEACARRSETAPAAAVQALSDAIRDFDEAAIFTIHGFCHRMLRENAFESGTLFDTTLTTDPDRIRRAVVEDYWRMHLYTAPPGFVRYAIERTRPESLHSLLGNRLAQPDLAVIPDVAPPDTRAAEADLEAAYQALKDGWACGREEVREILMNHPGLNRRSYSTSAIPVWLDLMDRYLRQKAPHPVLPEKFGNFTPEILAERTKKGAAVPVHPFFDLCGAFLQQHGAVTALYERKLLHLKHGLFAYARERVRRRMREENVQSFDDLLLDMEGALAGPGGERLSERIRTQYQAALIDEFQDTDPVQYRIFAAIFDVPGHLLFLIGDPKQAIYSFRGADIFAYMGAAKRADARFTLATNWRSDPALITAVNAVFSGHPQAFVYDEIPFVPATASEEKPEGRTLCIQGGNPAPFSIMRLSPAGKEDATRTVVQATAAEISRLLHLGRTGRATLGERPLRPGDIAVLVRTNREGAMVQDALTSLSIPSVLCNTGDIFDTHEAAETGRVVAAAADPRNHGLIRAALATDMLGQSGEALDAALRDESTWDAWLARFSGYHLLWRERGFIRMFKALLAEGEVLPRLMGMPDGERRCTNTLHLQELLHQAGLAQGMTPPLLAQWLSEQRLQKGRRAEEHPLRLESDENAVTLVTIHKSKGLEYPVVFCPFAWGSSRLRDAEQGILFHDERRGRRLTCDLGSEQAADHRMAAEKECLAENLRLLYVALTRAEHRCCLAWGPVSRTETSAPAYLFHGADLGAADADLTGALERRVKAMDDDAWEQDMAALQRRSGGTIGITAPEVDGAVRYAPHEDRAVTLAARRFSGRIPGDARISSFSSMISEGRAGVGGIHDPAELADYDALDAGPAAGAREDRDIFAFPRGARAGTCLHEIFEHIDFSGAGIRERDGQIRHILRRHRFDAAWAPAVMEMVEKVIKLDLDAGSRNNGPAAGKAPVLRLSAVPLRRRINEMAFYFPLKPVTSRGLAAVFAEHGIGGPTGDFPERIGRLSFSPARGMLKGFIDLVFEHGGKFYLVDWKSNHLGDRPEAYRPEVLGRVMAGALYILQYHLYALALHRYLSHRVPGYDYDTHFGGVRYLFLRGVDPEISPVCGMFRDRPERCLIENLDALLIDMAPEGA